MKIKKVKEVIKDHPEYKTLINSVIRRIGLESVSDVVEHGIDGGFSGFIYYKETRAFFRAHKADILKLAKECADDQGVSVVDMVKSFKCVDSDFSIDEIGKVIFGNKTETITDGVISNAMAWFAAEEVCRWFESEGGK